MGSSIIVEFARDNKRRDELAVVFMRRNKQLFILCLISSSRRRDPPPRSRRPPPGHRILVTGLSRDTSWQVSSISCSFTVPNMIGALCGWMYGPKDTALLSDLADRVR